MSSRVIKNLKDFYEVAKSIGLKCQVKRIDEVHAGGYMGVHVVVGWKANPLYRADANLDQPGLTIAQRKILMLEMDPKAPDIRVVWVRPGTTAEELVKEHLEGIVKSLSKKPAIITPKESKKAEDENVLFSKMAEDLEKGTGENVAKDDYEDEDSELGSFDDDDEEEIGDEELPSEVVKSKRPSNEEEGPADTNDLLRQLIKNQETLANDIQTLSDNQTNIEARINQVEGTSKPSPKDKKVSKSKPRKK